jgi:hypothetical protein
MGMPAFLKAAGEGNGSLTPQVMDAVEVLSSLGDFENFKATMIAQKNALSGIKSGISIG